MGRGEAKEVLRGKGQTAKVDWMRIVPRNDNWPRLAINPSDRRAANQICPSPISGPTRLDSARPYKNAPLAPIRGLMYLLLLPAAVSPSYHSWCRVSDIAIAIAIAGADIFTNQLVRPSLVRRCLRRRRPRNAPARRSTWKRLLVTFGANIPYLY